MFRLQLYDHHGKPLALGDIVRVNTGDHRPHSFYARVTWLKDEQAIAPFHTFSFHSFEKVDEVPANAIKSTETRYDIWWVENPDNEESVQTFEDYLMSWRDCEYNIKDRCFRIIPEPQLTIFNA